VCFRKPSSAADFDGIKALLSAVARVVEGCKRVSEKEGKGEWDGVCLAVALRRAVVPGLEVQGEEWEDVCMEGGFEFVDGEVGGIAGNERNEFGGRWWWFLWCDLLLLLVYWFVGVRGAYGVCVFAALLWATRQYLMAMEAVSIEYGSTS